MSDDYYFIQKSSFPLHPDNALGNILKLYVNAYNERVSIGDCSIALMDPNVDYIQSMRDEHYQQLEQEKKAMADKFYFIMSLVLGVVTVILLVICFGSRYSKIKKEKFTEMVERRNTDF
mmetsp:Transcript_5350/g.4539  ORF Transcript_5350/g.4539 Transcript_5350/m.4539 type:complete len:119 (+) Transcript_5350:428-784(+)|eukprot:CAMPEP_0114594568 /NCGR_PEP_ID=MMETSP0125-20121206/16233_1 /TAXON_ID=485358 ORGANISM="Aristerostoma sp., Strain ATCC 50986" /NCGR_SAMPLE_ID=MMETSP0125 /ASSEMBLY_ACC=CAM_ASM_000245 /LENGTH=118 /DNA_ID=CAMNT_0001795019 /DNA_START=418 /DNA_END=774 /DNA_ORIENTATION=+